MVFAFENIVAWQKAHQFTCLVYRITKCFPEDERYGLTSQFRRAAVSIGANIAEGYKKFLDNAKTEREAVKLRFLNISEGSLAECQNYILLSKDLKYLSNDNYILLHDYAMEVGRLLTAYCKGIINNNGVQE